MRGKINEDENNKDNYGIGASLHSSDPKKRLDLNVLLRRAKDQEKSDKKLNVIIFSGAASVIVVFFIILSL